MMDLVFKKRTISGIYDFSYFDFKNSSSMINRGNHMMILYNQSKLSEMLDYCQDLEKEYSSKNNYIRLLDIYSLKGFAFSNTEKEKFEKLISLLYNKLHSWYDKEDKYIGVVNDMYEDNILDDDDIKDIKLSKEKDDFER